jgi:molybdopterin/thiamine biosynthesis adenylyltransferase
MAGEPRVQRVLVEDASAAMGWEPLLLHPDSAADRVRIEELKWDARIQVLDQLAGQCAELRKLRPPVDQELLEETPRWAYYPWRRALVAVLGPLGFRTLRLDRNRNKITRDEQRRLQRQRIGVVGLSVGHTIAHVLAQEGLCGFLRLADFDALELSNLNRIPGTVLDLGLNKAALAARRIAEIDPYLQVEVMEEGLTARNVDRFLEGLDVVVEECDSLDVKLLVREGARARRIPLIMETSDRGLLDIERFDLEPERPPFHGAVGALRAEELAGLSTHDKVPYVLRILEPAQLSARMAASLAEIDQTVTTWPQLAGDVTLGGASVAAAVRRIGRGEALRSGRTRIDLDQLLDGVEEPVPTLPSLDREPPVRIVEAPKEPALALAHAANLAPSGGNVQPWRFTAAEGRLLVHLVPERTSMMDVRFRGSYVAIGAGLFNARVAAAARGALGPLELFPDGNDPLHVGTVRLGAGTDPELAELYGTMLQRSTNRRPGNPTPIQPEVVERLHAAVKAESEGLTLLSDPVLIREVGELLGASDRLRYLTPGLYTEMMAELRWPDAGSLKTGIDVRTLELGASDIAKLLVARRPEVMRYLAAWDAGRALGEVMRDRVASSSALAVVTVPGADPAPEAYVRGGAAVERLWVTAEHHGLAIQPCSPVFLFATTPEDFAQLSEEFSEELERLAVEFRSLIGIKEGEAPTLVMRVSHASASSSRSARIPVQRLVSDTRSS